MALQIFIAYTGQHLQAEPGSFATIEEFKIWVAKYGEVTIQNQITLTAEGKAVKLATLKTNAEIFVYDRSTIAASPSKSNVSQMPLPPRYEADNPPDTITDQTDLQAWRDLFMARRTWALKLVEDCADMSDIVQIRWAEIDVIGRSIWAAIENLQTHVSGLDQRFAEAQIWAKELARDQESVAADWAVVLQRLQVLPASTPMIRFIVGRDPRRGKQALLEDLIDISEATKAGSSARNALAGFTRNMAELGQVMDRTITGTDNVTDRAEKSVTRSSGQQSAESVQLMKDIEAIAKKVNSDYEGVLSYPDTPKSVSQASKSALLHTRNFLPNLKKRSAEMYELLVHSTETRNLASAELVEVMQAIGVLNTMCQEIVSRLEGLGMSDDDLKSFELVQIVDKLPVTYASFVAEAIRRREWNDKVKTDSSSLANEMAAFQDEEEKRRRKWQKSTGSIFWAEKSERKALGLEVNLLGEEEQWPQASRQELDDYLEVMKSNKFKLEVIAEVSQCIADLDNPTKQQSKRAKAFKAGSFHEAALGRSALLVRGDDDIIRSLQGDKARVESKLKGAESRVRRLEDLLHRQSQMPSKASTANVFQPGVASDIREPNNPIGSPRFTEDRSRRSSTSSRRFSANNGPEEKAVAQKIINLEAELIAERERASGLEKEISARVTTVDDIKGQMDDANAMKEDLLQNLEAQKREFAMERKSMETEIKELKAKIESYEEDYDRLIGSRENEKATVDERVTSLQKELEKVQAESAAETQKAQGQVDFLRNDAKFNRESNETLVKDLAKASDSIKNLKSRAEDAEAAQDVFLRALRSLHPILLPDVDVTGDVHELIRGLVGKSMDIVTAMEIHGNELQIARNERDAAEKTANITRIELSSTVDKLKTEEMETFELRESLAAERARYSSQAEEVADARHELENLRTKFAAGETGSEALRSRVEEEEKKAASLSENLAGARSQVGSLEEELRLTQDRLETAQRQHNVLSSRFESRSMRAKDLTQRLYAQNDRLCRLLERMSYSVIREGDSMIIQRVPRTERPSANDSSDPGSSMRRSISGPVPRKAMVDSGDLDLLYWMQAEDSDTESEKYDAYLNAIGNFDIEAFCETMLRRVKDIEHTARKYTKDARAYREKYQRAQKEAHEKIAFKHFKDGDLALFLPTRNQATGAWAAFNVGAPHYFLHEQDSHKLRSRDWLLARIHKIEERVVDLSKSMTGQVSNVGDRGSIGEASNGGDSYEDDNPFDLSDGLRWYLIEAAEEKPGAPSTPGLGKSTVATTSVDATGSTIQRSKKSATSGVNDVSKTLSRSLDSRRSSSNSKKAATLPYSGTAISPPSISDAVKHSPLQQQEDLSGPSTTEDSRLEVPTEGVRTLPARLSAKGSNLEASEGSNTPTKSTGNSPNKKSVIWDSLWSLDMSVERGKTVSAARNEGEGS